MKNHDCTVLVVSCDAYADVVPHFILLWRRFWPDCPFETVLLTESIVCDGFDRVLAVGKCNDWSPRISMAIEQISTPYLMLVLNDYFLSETVDTSLVLHRLDEAKRFDAINLRLMPNPPGRKSMAGTDLLEMPKNVAYCITCQIGIWNRDFFARLLSRTRSAWEFERLGSFMVGDESRPLLVTKYAEIPFIDAVHKGYWERSAVEVCERNGIEIDFMARGLPPLRVKLWEFLKRLVFSVLPWTLIVRIQNVFCSARNEESVRGQGV